LAKYIHELVYGSPDFAKVDRQPGKIDKADQDPDGKDQSDI
jgi:hypothetical protein